MKNLALSIILVTAGAASAQADYNCSTTSKPFQTTYEISSQGNSFKVSFFGNSRNTYQAVYTAVSVLPTRTGADIVLVKTKDLSTWKDMPKQLKLQDSLRYKALNKLVLKGLEKDIVFTGKDCTETP